MPTPHGKISWIDILKPSAEDISRLADNHEFHPAILEELKMPSRRARIEANKDYLFLIYYFPIYDEKERVSRRSEIDFLVTKDAVITVRYEENAVIEELKTSLGKKSRELEAPLYLIHKILESLIILEQRQLNHIDEKIDAISAEIFRDRERERERSLLERISYLKRDISQLRLIVRPQKQMLESLHDAGCGFLGTHCAVYVNDLIGEHMKVLDQLEDYRQAVEDFDSTNVQLINLKNSQVVKTFTILAFLTFPMMLFAALFSMNTEHTPVVGSAGDFWIIFAIMAASILGMLVYFKKKDWL